MALYGVAGDFAGNVRVYELSSLALLCTKEAHEGLVLGLDWCPPGPQSERGGARQAGPALLASAGADGAIHVFADGGGRGGADGADGYALANMLDEHAAAVTAVRFRSVAACLPAAGE